jgi:ketosteroid isomerase-like protein
MRRLVVALLTLWVGALALADSRAPVSTAATEGERAAQTLQQLERDWAQAEEAGDGDKIGRILAEDWTGINNDGSKLTKEQFIAHVKSGKVRAETIEFGPMEVKVLGDVAVVQGSVVEESTTNGRYTSGEIVWMDVFAKRHGTWVVVRSQSARAGMSLRPRWPI